MPFFLLLAVLGCYKKPPCMHETPAPITTAPVKRVMAARYQPTTPVVALGNQAGKAECDAHYHTTKRPRTMLDGESPSELDLLERIEMKL